MEAQPARRPSLQGGPGHSVLRQMPPPTSVGLCLAAGPTPTPHYTSYKDLTAGNIQHRIGEASMLTYLVFLPSEVMRNKAKYSVDISINGFI